LIKSKEDKSKTDRGWEQGNVGWGVLGAFGSNQKGRKSYIHIYKTLTKIFNDILDEIAQVMRRSDGTNKMIKNERGISYKLEYRF
jgi:hypothetical protein